MFCLLLLSPDAHNSQGWPRLTLRVGNSIQISPMDGRDTNTQAVAWHTDKQLGSKAEPSFNNRLADPESTCPQLTCYSKCLLCLHSLFFSPQVFLYFLLERRSCTKRRRHRGWETSHLFGKVEMARAEANWGWEPGTAPGVHRAGWDHTGRMSLRSHAAGP